MKIYIATKNKNKCKEFQRILEPMGFTVVTENDLGRELPDVEETGETFEENALLKANSGLKETGMISVADDSGLCVDYLDGAPGLYSARFSGEGATYESNNLKLLAALKDVPEEKRTAVFVSCIACVFPDGRSFTVRGECHGKIAAEITEGNGFGYDPIFISPIGVFSALSPEQKDSISHRGQSLRKFEEELKKYMNPEDGSEC
ncbi:MAG: RdgB/HAM1 family non-canonical purine NTP pyrophosphatase [Clostridia bacterium]|nr:RdgB/HAM1 family non-canonical purine NTP pyrophosphatase [Clostridia bacterium]